MSSTTFLSLPCPKCGATMRYTASTPADGSRLHHYACGSADCGARFTLGRDDRLVESIGADRPRVPFTVEGDYVRLQTSGLTLTLVPRSLSGTGEAIVLTEALPGIEAANPHIEFTRVDAD